MANNAESPLFQAFKVRSAGSAVFRKIQSYRDNGTHADEWLILFKVLLVMSSIITLGFGIALHVNLSQPYLGMAGAWAFAIVLTVFLELSKTVAGIWFFRNLFFGIFKQGIPSTAIMLAGMGIFLGSLLWSISNSTNGVQYLVKYLAPKVIERQVIDPAEKTADVDARINQTATLANKGMSSTWKGKTTVEGLRVARNASRIQAEQERQRTILLEQAAKEQERTDAHHDSFIDRVSMLFSMLGGKSEYFQVLLLAGIVLCELSLWQRIKAGQNTPAPQPAPEPAPAPPSPTPQPGGRRYQYANGAQYSADPPTNFHNGATTYNSDFKIRPHSSFFDTVARSPQTVPRSNAPTAANYADDVLKLAKKRLQANVANFDDKQRRPSTTAGNCTAIINDVAHKARGRGFEPSPDVAEDFFKYAQTVFEAMDANGYPYEYERQFLAEIEKYLPAAEAA